MYPPPYHQENEFDRVQAVISQFPLATLLSVSPEGEVLSTHLPLMWSGSESKYGKLIGHIDKNNPQASCLEQKLTAIFHGPDTYISPTVYASSGKLPTWNYVKVHVKGLGKVVSDSDWVRDTLIDMTERLEGIEKKNPFVLSPDNTSMNHYINYVVGFELEIAEIEGKFKLSQDKTEVDFDNAYQELTEAPIGRNQNFMAWLKEN